MKRTAWIVMAWALLCVPTFAQHHHTLVPTPDELVTGIPLRVDPLTTVQQVRGKYPTPLAEKHAAFLVEVACATSKGLLRKDWGTHIRLTDGTGVSQDILMERDGSHHYDILADGEGAAIAAWSDVGPIDAARYYAVRCGTPDPDPTPEPDQGVFAALLEQLVALDANVTALRAQVTALQARPFPSYVASNRYVGTFTLTPQK